MLNDNCSDTLLIKNMSAALNNPVEMGNLTNWKKLDRGNRITVDYSVQVNNMPRLSKRITAECTYGGKTDIDLKLE